MNGGGLQGCCDRHIQRLLCQTFDFTCRSFLHTAMHMKVKRAYSREAALSDRSCPSPPDRDERTSIKRFSVLCSQSMPLLGALQTQGISTLELDSSTHHICVDTTISGTNRKLLYTPTCRLREMNHQRGMCAICATNILYTIRAWWLPV